MQSQVAQSTNHLWLQLVGTKGLQEWQTLLNEEKDKHGLCWASRHICYPSSFRGDPNLLILFQKAMDRLAEDDAGVMAPCTSVTSQASLSKLLK